MDTYIPSVEPADAFEPETDEEYEYNPNQSSTKRSWRDTFQ